MMTTTRIAEVRDQLAAARSQGHSVGFVPTMGALHAGHRSLMRAARAQNATTLLSVFVNPLQFGAGEDLDRYPRDLASDERAAAAEGVDIVFAPSVGEMYPIGAPATSVHVSGVSEGLCGRSRPGHFDGVATVVAKLLSIVGPCRAYFGRKDFQQLAVVRRMVSDLDLPVDVVGCPIVREPDGLAMSSRNAYLSQAEREAARGLFRALQAGARAAAEGERDPAVLRTLVERSILAGEHVRLEYAEVVGAVGLGPLDRLDGEVLVAVAAHVGATRLIDNMTLSIGAGAATADLGVSESEAPCAAR